MTSARVLSKYFEKRPRENLLASKLGEIASEREGCLKFVRPQQKARIKCCRLTFTAYHIVFFEESQRISPGERFFRIAQKGSFYENGKIEVLFTLTLITSIQFFSSSTFPNFFKTEKNGIEFFF